MKKIISIFITLGIIVSIVSCAVMARADEGAASSVSNVISYTTETVETQETEEAPQEIKVGNKVLFGSYEQDNNTSNGKEAIEWEVLEDCNDGSVIVISSYLLDCQKFNKTKTKITWGDSTLRTWLNGTFCKNAFTADEQKCIIANSNANKKNQFYGISCGKTTLDKVWLLSLEEVGKYYDNGILNSEMWCFTPAKEAKKAPTAYAKAKGVTVSSFKNSKGEKTGYWWLRSMGVNTDYAACVYDDGDCYFDGFPVDYGEFGVCPVIRVEKSALKLSSVTEVKLKTTTAKKKTVKLKAPKKSKFLVKPYKRRVRIKLFKVKGAKKLAFKFKQKSKKKWNKIKIKANKTKAYYVRNLKKGKKYQFRIRYKKSGKWSPWSKIKTVKVK